MSSRFRWVLYSVVGLSPTALVAAGLAPAAGPTVAVTVSAADTDHDLLRYRWKATDGTVQEVNSATTTWTLPPGPGLHFLYVQVADGNGGYAERRIAINTDVIGTALPITAPVNIVPPAPAPAGEVFWHTMYDIGAASRRYYVPDAQVILADTVSGRTYAATTDLNGFFVTPKLAPGTYALTYEGLYGTNNTVTETDTVTVPQPVSGPYPVSYNGSDPYSSVGNNYGITPDPTLSPSQFFVGHMSLADGSPCGDRSPFFTTESTGTTTLLDSAGATLAGPIRINAHGDYWLSADLTGVSQVTLRATCEGAPPVDEPMTVAMNPAGSVNAQITRNITIPNHAPKISGMTATFNGQPVGTFLPPPSSLPSDGLSAPDAFLSFKGLDTRTGACQYYYSVGAVQGCDASGKPIGTALRFDDWKRIHRMAPYNTTNVEYTATYINKVDLNLTRNHHGTVIAADHTAAYVCNHLGPTDAQGRPLEDQASIDTAIDNAVNGKNLVACVAFDYSVTPGVNNNQPFTKYLTFGPSGDLLLSVNLDGRAEKFMPGVCVACHGGDHYHVRYPDDGSGDANIGAHFLPFDLDNFEFSSRPGLTETDQQAALKHLNEVVLATHPTDATAALIAGWYASGTDAPDPNYVPASWLAGTATDVDFYKRVLAPNCRTCHVAMDPQFNFDDFTTYISQNWNDAVICGDGSLQRAHNMPNSLVTFNRFWNSVGTANDLPAVFVSYWAHYTKACAKGYLPDRVFNKTAKRDFAGSSRSALLWQNGSVYNAWFMRPDGLTRSSAGVIANLSGTTGTIVGSGDFDGDGKADLLVQDGRVFSIRLMNGRTVRATAAIAGFGVTGWAVAGVGDFDGDGKDDILWHNGDRYNISYMDGITRRNFVRVADRTGTGWVYAATSDFDGDGMNDILWRNGDRYQVWVLHGTSVASKTNVANFTGTGWTFSDTWNLGAMWQNGSMYRVWSNVLPPRVGFPLLANFTGTGWTLAGTGDFNGDGYADFVSRNGSLFNVRLFVNETRVGIKNVANFTGTGWTLVP